MQELQETQFQSLGQEYPLEEEMTTYPSILSAESHAQRSLAGYSPHGHNESDMTEHTQKHNISNLWNATKAVLTGKITEIKAYIKTQGRSQINHLTLHFKELAKEQTKHSYISFSWAPKSATN